MEIKSYHFYAFTFEGCLASTGESGVVTTYSGLTHKFGEGALLTKSNLDYLKGEAELGGHAALLNVTYLGYGTIADFYGTEEKEGA